MDRPQPDLAAIVIAVGARPQLVDAVRSLLAQPEPIEIVVVNSGGGDARAVLEAAGIDIPVIASDALLLPGAARNRGITASRAPYVAFLAEDCLAAPGWAAARLAAHRAGHAAIGSALLNDQPRSPIATAAHTYLHYRRLPGTAPWAQLVYGASYDRGLFERHGLFRDDLRIGEDTEFHRRLPDADKPVWSAAVRTVHRTPGSLAALLRDHRKRGRHFAEAQAAAGLPLPGRRVAARCLIAVLPRAFHGLGWAEPRDRLFVVLGVPFMILGAAAYAFGALTGGRDQPAAAEEKDASLAAGP